ncbi:MAG: hypothetical protein WBC04_17635 [Candidatus Acidiferrales bacterium]
MKAFVLVNVHAGKSLEVVTGNPEPNAGFGQAQHRGSVRGKTRKYKTN